MAAIDERLTGTWVSDPIDPDGLHEFGSATLEFSEDGELTYTVHTKDKDQVILLRYATEGDTLVTDQPSAPRKERTAYSFSPEGKLYLWFGGRRSCYVRQSD